MARTNKVGKEIENNNRKSRFYLEALGETHPARLPLLPTSFSPSDRSSHISVREPAYVRVEYKGPGDSDSDSALVRSNHSIPVECGLFYFEIRIVNKGKDGFMGIGVSTRDARTNKLPGWDRGSYGYHGDDGKKFRGCGTGEPYGPKFTTGDVVGCIVNYLDSSISYTKNGIFLGQAFTDVKERELYPTVGMRSEGECMQMNCGAETFCFDLQSYIQEERSRMQQAIRETQVADIDNIACGSIISYLVQQGYPESALALAKSCGREKEVECIVDTIRHRRQVLDSLLAGDIPKVLSLLKAANPQLLKLRQDLFFMLHCQQFIELVRAGEDVETILDYGSELHSLFDSCTEDKDSEEQKNSKKGKKLITDSNDEGDDEDDGEDEEGESSLNEDEAFEARTKYHEGYPAEEPDQPTPQHRIILPHHRSELLEKVFSLVAYVDPSSSPHAYLLDPMMRTALADRINLAMQVADGPSASPTVERLSREARVVMDKLDDYSIVGLLMKGDVPLGYGDDVMNERSHEAQAIHFYDVPMLAYSAALADR